MSKPTVEIKDITPEWATEVLDKHDKSILEGKFRQRNVNKSAVDRYAHDMALGNWSLTGQGITFDEEGNLLDGQHRLYAVVQSKCTVRMIVMYDVPRMVNDGVRTIDTLDVGCKRNLANQLKLDGVSNYFSIASAARLLILMSTPFNRSGVSQVQGIQVAGLMRGHLEVLMKILMTDNRDKNKYSGRILAPLSLLRTADKDVADLFATEYAEMANLGKTSPVLQFHKFMERPKAISGGTDVQMAAMKALASALFFYANDKKCEHIRGNDEHMEWLMKKAKGTVSKIRDICGVGITTEELRAK